MNIITNDLEVFEVLERADEATFDTSRSIVWEFEKNEHWHLVIFSHDGSRKGFQLFRIEKEKLIHELKDLLLPELLSLPEEHGYENLKNQALLIVEKQLRSRDVGELFFDAQ